MNILVTGGAGYLGAVLLPKLLARGHKIKVLDIGYFGTGHLRPFQPSIQLIREDIRKVVSDPELCRGILNSCDCIIHLAALSNDPSADLNPTLTEEVNANTTRILAEAAKELGIRFLFSSSCSIYGETEGKAEESGKLEPLTTYAISKVHAEKALWELADSKWKPVILRNGTLFGYSPRMRFDLVMNIFSLYSTLHNQIKVFGDGLQWRPFLHVKDCARAFVHFAELPEPRHMCYNVAHENLRVVDIVPVFQKINPNLQVLSIKLEHQDRRNYRVNLNRMREDGFETQINVNIGAEEMTDAIIGGLIPDPESAFYQNAKWLKELGFNNDSVSIGKPPVS